MTFADLPEHVPTLDQLYETCGTDFELSLDVKDPAAAPQVTDVARAAGLDVLAALKAALDPRGILNPGKLGLPSPFGTVPWP